MITMDSTGGEWSPPAAASTYFIVLPSSSARLDEAEVQASAPETAGPAALLDEVAARAGSARVALEADTAAAAAARCDCGPVQAVAVPFAAAVAVDGAAPEAVLRAGSVEPVEAHWDAAAVPELAGFDAAVPKAARTAATAAGSADAASEAVLWAGSVEPVEAHWDAAAVPELAGFDAAVPKAARTAATAAGSADAAPVQAPRVAVVAPVELVAAYSDSGPRLAVPADAVSQREVQLRGAEPAHCSPAA